MTTTNLTTATEAQIEQLSAHAVNDVTREIMAHGIQLTYEQSDELGEVTLDWMHGRLGLNIDTSDTEYVRCVPPVHYVGRDADGNLVTADEVQS